MSSTAYLNNSILETPIKASPPVLERSLSTRTHTDCLQEGQESQDYLDTPSLTTGSSRSAASSIIICNGCENYSCLYCDQGGNEGVGYNVSAPKHYISRNASPATVIRFKQQSALLKPQQPLSASFIGTRSKQDESPNAGFAYEDHQSTCSHSRVDPLTTKSQTRDNSESSVAMKEIEMEDAPQDFLDSEVDKSEEDNYEDEDVEDESDEWSGQDNNIEAIVLAALGSDYPLAAHLIPILHRIRFSGLQANINQKVGPWRKGVTRYSESSGGSNGSPPESGKSLVPSPSNPRKRQRNSNTNDQVQKDVGEDEGDEDDENEFPKGLGDNNESPLMQIPYLACPFYKLDPRKYSMQLDATESTKKTQYRLCQGPGFKSIQRLKEHLKRKHRPVQCERCWLIFPGSDWAACASELESHRQLKTPCQLATQCLREGISDALWANLDKKSISKQPQKTSRIDKYWLIWDTIFPGITRPLTPWHDDMNSNRPLGQHPQEAKTFSDLFVSMLEHFMTQKHILFQQDQEEEMKQRTMLVAEKAFSLYLRLHWPTSSLNSGSTTSLPQSSQLGSSYGVISNPGDQRGFLTRNPSSASRSTIPRSLGYSVEAQVSPNSRRTNMPPPSPVGMQQMNQRSVADSMNGAIHATHAHGGYSQPFPENVFNTTVVPNNEIWGNSNAFASAGSGFETRRPANGMHPDNSYGIDAGNMPQDLIPAIDQRELAGLPDWQQAYANSGDFSPMSYNGGRPQ